MTFGRKIAMGFAVSSLMLVGIGVVSHRGLTTLIHTGESVAQSHVVIDHIAGFQNALKDAETGQRGYVLTGDDAFLEPYLPAPAAVAGTLQELRTLTADNASQQRRLDELDPLVTAKLGFLKRGLELRRQEGFEAAQKYIQAGEGRRSMDEIRRVAEQMVGEERQLLERRAEIAAAAGAGAKATIVVGTLLCLLVVVFAGLWITRSLTAQIGSAVQHVQSSSGELQAAASQQASGAKEQSVAMNEITATIRELLATSRQISDSARRVAQIADETATGARNGGATVRRSAEAIAGISRQVEQIVAHMLDLAKKSQQIGGILEIINELGEQTNILAINATIEAAGAGDAGRRFAVVADEVRKLADRVIGSTREIRGLIDDVRAAVNTTVMATESGTKAVEAGARQFEEVAASFQQIASLVGTTTEAAREIELSTKQQTTAVEQVNLAVANVAQASRETEASSRQTFDTASQLTGLSRELMRLIRSEVRA